MFLILLGGSLTFGAALLATVIFTDGALVALRTAAEIIGWLLLLATVAGLVGMRRKPGPPVRRQHRVVLRPGSALHVVLLRVA